MSDTQSPGGPRPDLVALIVEAFARAEITAERRSSTEVLIHIPEAEPFLNDYAEAVRSAREYPDEQYPELASQVVLALMRGFRERGVALGTHYPPRTSDHARGALLAVLEQLGLRARFLFPNVLEVGTPQGSVRTDVSRYLEGLEDASVDAAFDRAGPYAEALAGQIRQIAPQNADSAGRLRSRVYPVGALPQEVWDTLLYRDFAEGLRETVVIDTPDSVQPLNRSALESMDLTREQAFTQAVAASVAEEVEASEVDLGGAAIIHIGGAQPYTAAQAHVLSRFLGEAPHGALVAFPVREVVLAHPLGKGHPIMAMERLQELAERFVADAEKPISAQLFWWHPDSAERAEAGVPDLRPVGVKVDHEDRSVSLYTSDDEFGPLLNRLMEAG
ncbi:hypothetical protein ACOQFV_01355 [Nocardiopsis changdeensis]|uniref:Uncharacterized protein n=1 Tax=Nocardiopsis changdeensis TaxID=2831969 RepID=A0ABX8BJN4_9ACTN|nr:MULTISPECIES: hypothetical protein [Nocardiopsis]QUX22316.1 hypothetical protein KGD84_28940 [Nocardiopsis changdeensis]QYX38257.1 hypothetical protein K1J57_06325 [Nocardiopsis sp. MT53]